MSHVKHQGAFLTLIGLDYDFPDIYPGTSAATTDR